MSSSATGMPPDWPHGDALAQLAAEQRMVFVAGLPGVGKSLLLKQLARMARDKGRRVFLLQWDVARRAFETAPILARYPEINGFTHGAIKRAAGLWTRMAVLTWHRNHASAADLLLGETPLVGGRLIELAEVHADEAEPLLSSEAVRFVLPVPSREVRAVIEAARARSIAAPSHERERADAPPNVLQALWEDVYREGHVAGVVPAQPDAGPLPYDPDAYRAVYRSWLGNRHLTVVEMDRLLPVSGSVYDIDNVAGELTPTPQEVEQVMRVIDARAGEGLP